MKRISGQAVGRAFRLNMYDTDGYLRVDWNEGVGKKQIAQAQLDSCEEQCKEQVKQAIDDAIIAYESTCEALIKEKMRKVVEWLENNFEPTVPMSLDYEKWQDFKKEQGL